MALFSSSSPFARQPDPLTAAQPSPLGSPVARIQTPSCLCVIALVAIQNNAHETEVRVRGRQRRNAALSVTSPDPAGPPWRTRMTWALRRPRHETQIRWAEDLSRRMLRSSTARDTEGWKRSTVQFRVPKRADMRSYDCTVKVGCHCTETEGHAHG